MTTLLIILATAIVVTLLLATRLPAEFRVTRSTAIDAPADVTFRYLASLRGFAEWSPWAKMDPDAELVYAGTDGALGSSLAWKGRKTGEGTMTLVDVTAPTFAKYRLDFRKPMTATNHAEFRIETKNNQSVVCWTMHGHNNYMGKLMSLFMNCERMVGDTFESGLKDLKALAESQRQAA